MVVKVMQINSGQKFGGVSSMIFNFYKNVDHEKIQFDFVAPKISSFSMYRREIEEMGGSIIELQTSGNFIKRKLQFFKRLTHLIKRKKYDVVHINSGSIFLNIQVSWIAHFCGVKKIITHSHNAGNDHELLVLLTKLCKPLLEFGPTDYFACSNLAAKFMFTKKRVHNKNYQVINNGVDVQKFKFNIDDRQKYREKLSIQGKVVLLHVGRFTSAKNHQKLINIFKCFHTLVPNSVLLLAGEGELEESIHNQVEQLKLQDSVLFLGLRKDIAELMSTSDMFILPSFYEGLPVVGIEAQTNGLPCVFSDSITKEVDLNDKENLFLSLELSDQKWAKKIEDMLVNSSFELRYEAYKNILKKGYSLVTVGKILEKIYLNE
ncbi:glycosyltransferase [Companilactobacillus futsaii]|uniref:glycosyltransferase n=1 Tax=Companilactobacillus futsaii TaxID=938155 RepID=UPI0018A729AA|nr:glycosyltransferase [Companilactobacillus futsaii]